MKDNKTTDIPSISRESLIMERLSLAGARVIDIGCGQGWLTQLVAPDTDTVIGIDPSATALGRASAINNGANGYYVLASADNLPLNHAWANIAIYYNSLHHVPAAIQSRALKETARVLTNDGILCIVEPVARGSAYELFQPVDDESEVYATTHELINAESTGIDFQHLLEQHFIDCYSYRNFEHFLDDVLVVDDRRAGVLSGLEDELRDRFERLGKATEGGRSYDQVHRLDLLRKL
ncbi:MAG: class I SAM-dependent methyltransferase [Gammaproteobacteria bacterium]|nr:class I SAM-dependent methyltransferase [Gammaproteobacteria bacterium]